MRTAILLGLILIADAINDNVPKLGETGMRFIAAFMIVMMGMDLFEFFNKLISKK